MVSRFLRLAGVRPYAQGSRPSILLLERGAHPGERNRARIRHSPVSDLLRLLEGLGEISWHPRKFFHDLLFDGGDMHDRENSGLAEIREFDVLVIGKEPHDPFVTRKEQARQLRREHGGNFTLRPPYVEPFSWRDLLDAQVLGRRKGDVLAALDDPRYLPVRQRVFLLQDAAHPDIGRRLKIRAAYFFTDQLLRRANAGRGVDEEKPVAK